MPRLLRCFNEAMRQRQDGAEIFHLQSTILLPALAHARERQLITAQEQAVLQATVRAGTVKAGELEAAMPGLNAGQRTYQIRKLVEGGLLQPVREGARQYTLGFRHNMLLRGVVKALADQGFVPAALAEAPP